MGGSGKHALVHTSRFGDCGMAETPVAMVRMAVIIKSFIVSWE